MFTVLALAGVLISSTAAHAQQKPAPESAEDAETRRLLEAQIQKCVNDKTASPQLCRMTAYATALAAGFSPEQAARFSGYRPPDRP